MIYLFELCLWESQYQPASQFLWYIVSCYNPLSQKIHCLSFLSHVMSHEIIPKLTKPTDFITSDKCKWGYMFFHILVQDDRLFGLWCCWKMGILHQHSTEQAGEYCVVVPFCTCANLETGVWLCRTEKCYSVLPSLSAQSPNRMELWHSYHIFYKNATTLSDLETEHLDYVLSQVCFSSSRRYTELLGAYCAL